ncbi:hypothetical protein OG2516_09213 [Oceanicola granulosus HTCC2516]|uniref:DUF202 domain-containing protein n=1 Tax=Oceanicola granulosus (strain ATCC BAA-861 / DSM 15982 / KCTC 12143 / HTCC2516) TaxID=314256 RepID=Q2CDT4_OCEGH|nr:DUF202 domain-containing protein [Oceanicola granulosus]EAR50766.1 hypothetical protein OG2516_09213 [Oceanicola granulosus HTCC2516]
MNPKQEMAQERTDWAEDRTILANERTFAGWMRTGMAGLAVAIGLKAVFGAFEPTWVAKAVATVFVVVAIIIFVSAAQQSRRAQQRIDSHIVKTQSSNRMTLVAAVLTIGSVGVAAVLWLL